MKLVSLLTVMGGEFQKPKSPNASAGRLGTSLSTAPFC